MLKKCPRCELNYIFDGEQYCKICKMEMKGEQVNEEAEMCTVCGEHPVMPGKDVCLYCYKEMNNDAAADSEEENGVVVSEEDAMGIDPISGMDEMIPENEENADGELSLEAMGEEEEDEDEDEEDEDNMSGERKHGK